MDKSYKTYDLYGFKLKSYAYNFPMLMYDLVRRLFC